MTIITENDKITILIGLVWGRPTQSVTHHHICCNWDKLKYNTGTLTFEELCVLIMMGSLHLAVRIAVKTQLQWTGCSWHNDITIQLPWSRHNTHLTRQTTVCCNETQTLLSVWTTLAVPKERKPVSVSRIRFLPAHIWAQDHPHNVSQYVGRIKYI